MPPKPLVIPAPHPHPANGGCQVPVDPNNLPGPLLPTYLPKASNRAAWSAVAQVDSVRTALGVALSPRALTHEGDVFDLHLRGVLHGEHLVQDSDSRGR